jgi:UDP-2,3-diacylglucosamine pyrophosphatase LpxH
MIEARPGGWELGCHPPGKPENQSLDTPECWVPALNPEHLKLEFLFRQTHLKVVERRFYMDTELRSKVVRAYAAEDYEANAKLAKQELQAEIEKDPAFGAAVRRLASFWKFWYLVCGHKHLGRILVEIAKQ